MWRYIFAAALCSSIIAAGPLDGHPQEARPDGEIFIGASKSWEYGVGGPYGNYGPEVALTGYFNRHLGVEFDIAKFQDISGDTSGGTYGDYFQFLSGPHFAYNANSRVSPFAHVLVGVTRGLTCPPNIPCVLTSEEISRIAFSAGVGGGFDIKLYRALWVRPIQADYVHVSFPNGGENNLQLSFGVTFRWGSMGKTRKQ
jgi:hypothetical protein